MRNFHRMLLAIYVRKL